MSGRLLERGEQIRVLSAAARAADRGQGSLVLISGEAGAGKSALVRASRSWVPAGARTLTGYCEALATPRALGPLKDLASQFGPDFRAAVHAGDRERLMAALVSELSSGPTTVLVIEDLHWADEGSLDVLRYAARRLADLPVALVVTFRDDEAGPAGLSSLVAHAAVQTFTLPLPPLSAAGVRALCEGHPVDSDAVFRLTTGNPYLVTEVLAGGATATPASVVAATTERLARLTPASRGLVEQLAVIPGLVEARLAAALVGGAWEHLAASEEAGVLTVANGEIAFRHELTRLAVLRSVRGARQLQLHRRVLDALVAQGDADPGRLVHHAVACGDLATVVAEGPRAAREAAASGAHREGIAHYRTVLGHEAMVAASDRGALWQELAIELYRAGDSESVTAAERAVDLRREHGDDGALIRALCWLSRVAWLGGQPALATDSADEAVTRAQDDACSDLRAIALENRSHLAMLHSEHSTAIDLGRRAVACGRDAGDQRSVAAALNDVGTSLMVTSSEGEDELRESIAIARSARDVETACRGYVNLSWGLIARHANRAASAAADAGLALAVEVEHRVFEVHITAIQARIALADSDWPRAITLAAAVPDSAYGSRAVSLVVEGLVAARTASGSPFDALHEAWRVAQHAGELQRRGPVASAAMEASFLAGVLPPITRAQSVYREAERLGDHRLQAELAYRLHVAGHTPPAEALSRLARHTDSPFLLQVAGRWRDAAHRWHELGQAYAQAQALAEADDVPTRLTALELLDELGAAGLAQRVRRWLRDAGVTSVPRGPSPQTRSNPNGLTDRQLAVLKLVAEGLTNAEIAERLVLSRRTVDSHVSAVLAKLDVSSRRGAARAFREFSGSDLGRTSARSR